MKTTQLLHIAILLAIGGAWWLYMQSTTAYASVQAASARLEECQQLTDEIKFLRTRNGESISIAPVGFDPSSVVVQAARDANLPTNNFSVGQTTQRVIEGTGVRLWRVNIPSSKITLSQAVAMIRNLAEANMHYQVNSIKLTANPKDSGESELWTSEFTISYLKEDQD